MPKKDDLFKIRSTQSRQEIFATSILLGLQKTEKINASPFDFYYYKFFQSIIQNPSLLIIGYSFGDFYINQLLSHFYTLHSERRRVVIITYYSEPYLKNYNMDESSHSHAFRTITRLMHPKYNEEEFPGLLYRMKNQKYGENDCIVSCDKTVRVYYKGFLDAARKHGQEIINFLNFKDD